jgi:hypothetical protein
MKSNFIGVKTISDGIESLDLKAIADQTLDLDMLPSSIVPFALANEELIKILQRREASSLDPHTPRVGNEPSEPSDEQDFASRASEDLPALAARKKL